MANVSDMSYLFDGARAFSHATGGWDTSKVASPERISTNVDAFNHDAGG